jgi:hypothetical protein
MGIGKLGNAIELLSDIFSDGNGTTNRQVIIEGSTDSLTLPVTPTKYTISDSQKNKVVDITQLGEMLIFGMPKLRTLSFSSFFPLPDHEYPFVVGDSKTPTECIELLKKWKETRKPVRVIITDTPVNLSMAIMDMQYNEQDGSRDIYFSLSLTEYKEFNTSPTGNDGKTVEDATGLKDRPTETTTPTQATLWQKGSDVMDAAKKAYGKYSKWRRIVESNDIKDLAINNLSKVKKLKVK